MTTQSRRQPCALAFAIVAASAMSGAAAQVPHEVAVHIEDPSPWHVHPPGRTFEVRVTVRPSGAPRGRLFARWVDHHGKAVGEPIALRAGTQQTIASPATRIGYYGLVFHCDDANVAFPPQPPGFGSQEFGFAILPAARRFARRPDCRFGTIHAAVRVEGKQWDPYLRGHHIKTLTWNTVSPSRWRRAIQTRRDAGLTELPVINAAGWKTDGHRAMTKVELDAFADRVRRLAKIVPNEPDWELGIEENLGDRYKKEPFYFANLAAKARRMRGVLKSAGKRWRLVYNVEGFEYDDIERFLKSAALPHFQVFANHPYRWKKFESPEPWLGPHLRKLRAMLDGRGRPDMPIWLTEFGIPVRGNRDPKGFFGYPKLKRRVPGATRDHAARYLVKSHVIAFAHGVERLYVYNYQNRGGDARAAEDHFGLRSYTGRSSRPGFPLPAYVAYVTLSAHVRRRAFVRFTQPHPDVWCFRFRGVVVAWVHPDGRRKVPWSALGVESGSVRRVVGLYQTPRVHAEDGVELSGSPTYVLVRD